MTNPLYWNHVPSRPKVHVLRRAAAAVLHGASTALNYLAHRLTVVERKAPPRPACLPEIEFHPVHSEAGAPEGALYVDGKLVGYLPVTRL
jgi:hypothetical protein